MSIALCDYRIKFVRTISRFSSLSIHGDRAKDAPGAKYRRAFYARAASRRDAPAAIIGGGNYDDIQ